MTVTHPTARTTPASTRRPVGATVLAYVALTKPRIIETLLVTTVPTMFLAARGLPDPLLVVLTLVGGVLAAGSANTLNCYIDRDIDQVMHRTRNRPLATGALRPREALVFGLVLGVVAVTWFAVLVNRLSAVLALAAIAFYVLVYTMVLKRRTPQNIVWGGAAGCMQVLIGWAAATGRIDWAPVVLFMVIFLWTPPHYWPLSMRFEDDYAAAGVPMLPVVADDVVVARRVVAYSWAMVLASLALVPVAPTGVVYAASSLVLGAMFLLEAHRLLARARAGVVGKALNPMRLFHFSITYVSLLFVAVAVDPFVGGPLLHR
ncbi:heme o synthase [Angustibacter aerolatus]|uniref:Protoheme IX farnesyltransferase n=1 Tax=Angustibacter aerolatus TaxID=1162965 RepID=A0ABQ6J9Y8_9ACTN|nr:heme o synthase [Angustibacter aerolatus]GMA85001.1 protoheme IX farnesyltransferase [Angustibacter aerolatus]